MLGLAGGDEEVHCGNTDRVGAKAYNEQLAARRAKSVIGMLESMGIPSAWITSEAFGEENPISISRNPHDALNRRVDIAVEPITVDEQAIKAAAEEMQQ